MIKLKKKNFIDMHMRNTKGMTSKEMGKDGVR
jgi:hypothetical protein